MPLLNGINDTVKLVPSISNTLDIVYPSCCICLACDMPLHYMESVLCGRCGGALIPITGSRCRVCSRQIISEINTPDNICGSCKARDIDERLFGVAPFNHDGVAAKLIYALKYDRVTAASIPLIEGMLDVLPSGYDALVPVPLYYKRERKRGFNHSRVLCEGISVATNLPIIDALKRKKPTRQQMTLPLSMREENVNQAFIVVRHVKGMKLLLVDDVRTTGFTSLACALALYNAGAYDVKLMTATLA